MGNLSRLYKPTRQKIAKAKYERVVKHPRSVPCVRSTDVVFRVVTGYVGENTKSINGYILDGKIFWENTVTGQCWTILDGQHTFTMYQPNIHKAIRTEEEWHYMELELLLSSQPVPHKQLGMFKRSFSDVVQQERKELIIAQFIDYVKALPMDECEIEIPKYRTLLKSSICSARPIYDAIMNLEQDEEDT